MVYNRKAIAPWSTERSQGIESATVDSNIETPQYLQPVVNTGSIDLNGNWIGVATSDKLFTIDAAHEGIANGGETLSPQAQPDFINMTGFSDLFIGIKPTVTGAYAISAVMGPNTNPFANLTPVTAGRTLYWAGPSRADQTTFNSILFDASETLVADQWNIFSIQGRAKGQKLLQFKITNNSGAESDIQFAYQRLI